MMFGKYFLQDLVIFVKYQEKCGRKSIEPPGLDKVPRLLHRNRDPAVSRKDIS